MQTCENWDENTYHQVHVLKNTILRGPSGMVEVLTHGRVILVWFKIWFDHFEMVELDPRRLKRLLHIEKGVSNPHWEQKVHMGLALNIMK